MSCKAPFRSFACIVGMLVASSALAEPAKTGFVHKKFERSGGEAVDYVVFVPHSYDGKKESGVILFLHGSGETKGESGKQPVDVGIGPYIRKNEKTFPYIVVFPQAQEKGWRPKGINGELALGMLDTTLKEYKIDANRVYLTGLSMGGFGTFNFAAAEPQRWAAIVPICGGGNTDWAEKIKDIPCWVFHGAVDPTVNVSKSRDMVEALKKAGGSPKYTEFPKAGHNCWDQAYATPALWTWLAEQKRK
jgi:predicted peptidase